MAPKLSSSYRGSPSDTPDASAHGASNAAYARASASLDQPVGDQEDAVFGDFVAGQVWSLGLSVDAGSGEAAAADDGEQR